MTSLVSFSLHFTLLHHRLYSKSRSNPISIFTSSPSKSLICFSTSQNSSNFEREEVRWLREEQRWLREEQRWQREEQRWLRERELLLQEIQILKLRLQSLDNRNPVHGASVSDTISSIGTLLEVLNDKNLIAESGTGPREMILEETREEVKEVVVEEAFRVVEKKKQEKEGSRKRKVLRNGNEGDDVREMQDALRKLGFYSGEEDMEFSSFSAGTERAVKAWQATIGTPESGIMTAELLERLYIEERIESSSLNSNADKKEAALAVPCEEVSNGAAVASIKEISAVQQTVVQEDGITDIDVSRNRVFLLGENRWEDSSRLIGRDKKVIGSKTTTKCLTCRGEGRLLCLECDGTGEPNIEPQFLEWVGEETKCPYCEGRGYSVCDVCDGKPVQ